ncbi:MAG TPA: hypothetical protein VL201_04040 [Patescibacteria group bacterium]|jgi:hypothetical protein|nr:hypothetical protein [Patescibacteria group bacterium]
MKSLIEEASTIGKAVEKAWERAGKPEHFSVKICENPEYGFLGITKKYGKVVFFFEDSSGQNLHNKKFQQQEKKTEKDLHHNTRNKKSRAHEAVIKNEGLHDGPPLIKTTKEKINSVLKGSNENSPKKDSIKKYSQEYFWTEPMINYVRNSIVQTIHLLERTDISFNLKNEQQNLIVIFNGLLVYEPSKEHVFYKHFAHLLITALRTKFKTEFKHLRLVLSRE